MAHGGQDILIKDTLVFLFAAGIFVPAMRLSRIPAVLGFILAGVFLGPFGLGALSEHWPVLEYFTMTEPEAAAPFAELGVLFLLFLLGLELSFAKLWAMRKLVFGAGAIQAGVGALVIGLCVYALGMDAGAAALIGLALALSSTAIVMQLMIDEQRAATPAGRASLSVLLFQDLLVAPILIFVGFLSKKSDASIGGLIIQSTIEGLSALVVILFIGRFLLAPLFRLAARTGGRDFLMAITLLTVVGAAVITAAAGLSLALGAFLAGLLLGETEFKHQTEVDLQPFKSLLLGLFFMTVGMSLDLTAVWRLAPQIALGLVGLLVIKFAVTYLACRFVTRTSPVSIETAALLAPAGEFAFVILTAGASGRVIDGDVLTLASAVAGLSMMITPFSSKLGLWAAAKLTKPEAPTDQAHIIDKVTDLEGHVIISGFGRVGQTVAHVLEEEKTEYIALDSDPKRVAQQREHGRRVYLGDASRTEIMEIAGIKTAAMAVLTLDDAGLTESMVRCARGIRPDIPIIVRSRDMIHARELYNAGANFVVPETIEAGLQLASRTLQEFGYDEQTARDRIAHERDREYKLGTGMAAPKPTKQPQT